MALAVGLGLKALKEAVGKEGVLREVGVAGLVLVELALGSSL